MEYRAPVEEITDYIKDFTKKMYRQVPNPDFMHTIFLNPASSYHALRLEMKDCVVKLRLDGHHITTFDESKGEVDHVGNKEEYFEIPEDCSIDYTDPLWRQTRSEVEKRSKTYHDTLVPQHPQFKQLLRNAFVFKMGHHRTTPDREGYDIELTDYHVNNPHHMTCRIEQRDFKYSAVVTMKKRVESQHINDSGFENLGEVYKIPPLKLTKFLKKIGMSERFCTLLATKVNNKPREFSIHFTDKYIPECYMEMNSRVKSCMSKAHDAFDLPDDEHPTLPYEGSDSFLLGLIKDESRDGEDFPYVARVIIRVDSGRWGGDTIYGLEVLNSLEDFGLDEDKCMEGAKLVRIESSHGGILAPYVDGMDCKVDDRGDELVCDCDGNDASCYESGRLKGGTCCSYCEDYGSDMTETEDGLVCPYCLDNYYVWIDHSGIYVHEREAHHVLMPNGTYEYALIQDTVYSEYHGEYLRDCDAYYSDRGEDYILENEDEDDCFPPDDTEEEHCLPTPPIKPVDRTPFKVPMDMTCNTCGEMWGDHCGTDCPSPHSTEWS
jgi:hypothetical protein